jgi:hypothetical protein
MFFIIIIFPAGPPPPLITYASVKQRSEFNSAKIK